MKQWRVLLGGVGMLAVAAATPAAAGLVFSTPTGSTVGGNDVSATADFSILSANHLQIVLRNDSPANGLEAPTNTLTGLSFQVTGQSSGLSHDSALLTSGSVFV